MFSFAWDDCPKHVWEEVESQFENDVRCVNCGMPGDKDPVTGNVFFPAT